MHMQSNHKMIKRRLLKLYMKAHAKWDHFQSITCKKINVEVQNPPFVRLAFDWLLQVLGIKSWAIGNIPCKPTYALRRMKTFNPSFALLDMCMKKEWRWYGMAHIGSKNACNKIIQKWEFGTVMNFHEIKIIHGQYALISILFSLFGLGFFWSVHNICGLLL